MRIRLTFDSRVAVDTESLFTPLRIGFPLPQGTTEARPRLQTARSADRWDPRGFCRQRELVEKLPVIFMAAPSAVEEHKNHCRETERNMAGFMHSETNTVTTERGERLSYRQTGSADAKPLLLLQHFRGSLDNWDPALIDGLATNRRVITFDNVGVAGSSGVTPSTVAEMARDAVSFVSALGLDKFDLLGFSIGSFVAQEMLLTIPDEISSAVLASAAPEGASGMHGWTDEVMAGVGTPQTSPKGYTDVFFTHTPNGLNAASKAVQRIFAPRDNRDSPTTWQTRNAQYAAVCAWGEPEHAKLQRVSAIETPVFIANGDSDPMVLPRYSYLLAGLIPGSSIKLYPDAAHGFLFQHYAEFADDVLSFLD
jgi:pimeloyl-ACP methyl ester carboxylesterase